MRGGGAEMSKRVEIVKVPITGPEGTTVEVDGKECTKCGEVKESRKRTVTCGRESKQVPQMHN